MRVTQGEARQPRKSLARTIRMDGAQRAWMTGVHRVEQVESLAATNLADDNAIGRHAQRLVDEHLDGDGAFALGVGQPALERDAVRELAPQVQLRLVFDGDDALVRADESRKHG